MTLSTRWFTSLLSVSAQLLEPLNSLINISVTGEFSLAASRGTKGITEPENPFDFVVVDHS